MACRFVAVGEVMLDVAVPEHRAGATVHAPVSVRPGGTAVNAARAARAAGAAALVVGRVGDDAAGAGIAAVLAAEGVEARLVVDPERPTGTFVELADGSVVADRGAAAALRADDVLPLAADAVLVSGYAPAETAAAVLARADARWRALVATPAADVGFLERAAGANALFANEAEAAALGGLEALAARFELVCVTLGARGALVARGGRVERLPPTGGGGTGAGDRFAGAFLGGAGPAVDA